MKNNELKTWLTPKPILYLNRAPKLFANASFEVNAYFQPVSGDNPFRHVEKSDKDAEYFPRSSGKITLWSILFSP